VTLRAGAAAARSLPAELHGPLIFIGLCGALRRFAVGTTVVYNSACDFDGAVDARPTSIAGAISVRGFTSPRIVTTTVERAELAARYDADVVDMEGTHVARALASRGFGCAMVRVVSDGSDAELPPIANAIDAEGTLQPLVLAAAFAREPVAAVRFIGDVRQALRVLSDVAAQLTSAK
jgi:uridine phosphorylase